MDAPSPAPLPPRLHVIALGRLPYADALALQRRVARARIAGAARGGLADDVLLLVEHPPVVTLGRSTKATSLPLPVELIRSRGVEVHEIERGGDVTVHAPGQLVGYPIVDLKRHRQDLHWYLRQVEEALVRGVAPWGIAGGRAPGYTGLWVGDGAGAAWVPRRKLASIGVHARDWVTWHGFALNVTDEPLPFFDLVVPCGIAGVTMTSVAREATVPPTASAAGAPTLDTLGAAVAQAFGEVFDLAVERLPPYVLHARLAAYEAAADAAVAAPAR